MPDIEPGTLVTVVVVPVNVVIPDVDASTARRKANGWLADHVGHLDVTKDPRMLRWEADVVAGGDLRNEHLPRTVRSYWLCGRGCPPGCLVIT